MATKKFEKGSEEWQLFNDYYKFRQQFYEADNNEEWFQGMVNAGDELISKYANTSIAKYAQSLVLSHLEDVELRWMNKRRRAQWGRLMQLKL